MLPPAPKLVQARRCFPRHLRRCKQPPSGGDRTPGKATCAQGKTPRLVVSPPPVSASRSGAVEQRGVRVCHLQKERNPGCYIPTVREHSQRLVPAKENANSVLRNATWLLVTLGQINIRVCKKYNPRKPNVPVPFRCPHSFAGERAVLV